VTSHHVISQRRRGEQWPPYSLDLALSLSLSLSQQTSVMYTTLHCLPVEVTTTLTSIYVNRTYFIRDQHAIYINNLQTLNTVETDHCANFLG